MGKMETTLRSEIQRLARKEIRAECRPLQKQLKELKREVRKLSKAMDKGGTAPKQPAAKAELPKVPAAEVKKARFSAGLCKKLRERLNITQDEMATLLDVSPTTVAFWEQGRNRPTEESMAGIVALRKLGRRDIKRLLQAKA